MGKNSIKARELFLEGYNCSQAVLGAFCDELGFDFETAMKLSSSFGGGMGRLREVCGAVTGAFMVMGLKYGYHLPTAKEEKAEHYKLIQEIAQRFKDKNGSIICRELLDKKIEISKTHIPDERTAEYYKSRPCLKMVEDVAEIVEEILREKV